MSESGRPAPALPHGPAPRGPLPTRLHALSPARVRLVAATLFLGVTALLFATQDAGFTRDESFYFDYAERYQAWHVDVEEADTAEARHQALSREPTERVWRGNFEHPPLMKELFGLSWRLFARKDRPAVNPRPARPERDADGLAELVPDDADTLRVTLHLGRADGFPRGADVTLLAPQAQGQAPTDPDRALALGVVATRAPDRAELLFRGLAPAARDALLARCAPPPADTAPALLPLTPCMARESRALALMSESQAMRLPGIVSGGLAATLTFLFGELLFGWLAALLAALLFLFVPEHFFHAHLAAFDMPIVAAQLFTVFAFWRAQDDRRWALAAGFAWGLALLTKHNAFFLPFGLVLYWLWCGRDHLALRWTGLRRGLFHLSLPPLPLAFLAMPLIALPLLFAFWPGLWYDPLRSLADWMGFHLDHEHYMQYWFGQPLQVPPFPFGYPFAKSALTYPEVFLALLPVGLLALAPPAGWRAWLTALRRRAPASPTERVTVYLLLNGLLPILIIALPSTPIFGGIKHWMTGAPFLALIAAYGLFRLTAALRLPTLAAAAVALLVVAHPAKASLDNAWLGTNYYNALAAGGLQGGADKLLMRIFWGHEARWACAWLSAHAPRNARVYWQDATWGTYAYYQREGWLRHDIRYHPGPAGADLVLNETLQALWDIDIDTRRALEVAGPLWTLDQDGVPYLAIYARPELGLTRPAARQEPWAPAP